MASPDQPKRGLFERIFRRPKPTSQRETVRHPTRVLVMPGARMVATERGTKLFPLVAPDVTSTDTTLHVEVSAGAAKMRGVEFVYKTKKASRPNENVVVLTTGGEESSGQSRADEAARQLVSKYGLPRESVVSLRSHGSTLGNAAAVAEYLRTHSDALGHVSEIELVENEYKILRAWLMFSATMFKLATGRDFQAPQEHKERIREILFSGSTAGVDNLEVHMDKFNHIRTILEPYFRESRIRVDPIVVEEMLEKGAEGLRGTVRYVREYITRIRSDPSLLARLNLECQGAWDFLYAEYKTKD